MILNNNFDKILIIDFGSQFTQLIARRIRELGVYSEIISHKKIIPNFFCRYPFASLSWDDLVIDDL